MLLQTAAIPPNLALDATLHDLVRAAKSAGITLSLHRHTDELIELVWFYRDRDEATAGEGAAWLRRLCDYADATGKTIQLEVAEGRDRLREYYMDFGFSVVSDTSNDVGKLKTFMQRCAKAEMSLRISALEPN